MSTVAASAPGPQSSMSPIQRFIGVFYSPGETFNDIARKPDYLFPLVVLIIASVALIETMIFKIGVETMVRTQLEASPRAASMSPEQMEQAVHQGAAITAVIMHVSGVVGTPIFLMIITGVGLLILNVVLGAQVGFLPVFSVTCYAALVRLVGVAMGVPLIFFGDHEHFNPQNPFPSNLGFFLNPTEVSKPLYSLASSLDFLTLWFLIVLAIGLSRITGGKVKTLSIFLCFLGLWVLVSLAFAGLAAIFS